jgi:signal transduction histidine kinase
VDRERFRGLIAIQQRISAEGGSLAAVMKAVVDETSVMPQANGIVIELRDADQLYYAAASGSSAELIGLRLPLNSSLSGMSILTGVPLQCEDSETDSRVNRQACRRVGLRSMIVVPIPYQGQTVGVLKYHAPEPSAFSEEDMLIAHLLVGPIAVGFSNIGEADAQRAKSELQKIVALKEQFVSTVSHELRTPLTSIAGALALLSGGSAGQLPDSVAALVDIASRNAGRLKRLVDDLLDLDRLDGGKIQFKIDVTDIGALLVDVVEQMSPFANETGVRLTLDWPRTPVIAMTDGDRLFQVIANLISNAAKFSPAGSTVGLLLSPGGDSFRIRVTDQGPGIPAEFRSRLFDRFSQSTHTAGLTNLPGTGLGLAISRAIVEQLGGKLSLDEVYVGGAAFDIALPLAAPVQRQGAA